MCSVPTETLKAWVCERYRVSEDRVVVVPNFLDTEVFYPQPEAVSENRTVVYVGNISPVKNPELLVRACAEAGTSLLTFVGAGPEAEKVKRLATGIGVRVEIMGRVPNSELPEILRKHTVYVQPSIREGQCKSLMEAMACGMPCVGTDVVGTRDSIQHEKTGLLCPPESVAMASAIQRLFNDESLRRRLGKNAAEFVRSEYAFERVFEREYEIVSALAGGRKWALSARD
jgi:glycosyltransferase involved in cell wall biosynthesis